jgi:hypothetical protein
MSIDAGAAPAPPDKTTDAIIADCDGDPRDAVIELLAIIRCLIHENQTLFGEIPSMALVRSGRMPVQHRSHAITDEAKPPHGNTTAGLCFRRPLLNACGVWRMPRF